MPRLTWLVLLTCAAVGAVEAQDTSLVGLWYAKRYFGPEVRGELIVQRTGGRWQASIGARTADVRVARDSVTFDLPTAAKFKGRVAILGVSEGGWVAPLAASRLPSIRAIVTISRVARTKGDAYVHKIRREAEGARRPQPVVDSLVREAEAFISAAVRRVRAGDSARGFDRRIAYDPTTDWEAFRGPVLYMGGEADAFESGPAAAEWFHRLSERTGNADVTVRLWPRAPHSLLLGMTGEPAEYQTLRRVSQLAPGYWDVLLHWLDTQVRNAP